MGMFIAITSGAVASVAFAIFLWDRRRKNLAMSQTVVFTLVSVSTLLHVFTCRSVLRPTNLVSVFRNPWLVGSVALGFLMQLFAVYHPWGQRAFGTVPFRGPHGSSFWRKRPHHWDYRRHETVYPSWVYGANPMIPWTQIIILLISGVFLTGAAHLVIQQSTRIARRFGLSDFTMGFLLLGLFTSMPELFVAIQSVSDGIPQLSVGNLLGGSILLLSFVMGVTSIIQGQVALDHRLNHRELILMISVIAAPIAVLWDGQLTRIEGGVLVGLYILHSALLNHGNRKGNRKTKQSQHGLVRSLLLLALGITTLFISSRVIVTQAEFLMRMFSIAPILFGLFFLSIGTNLPELALALDSIRNRRKEIAFGDFLAAVPPIP